MGGFCCQGNNDSQQQILFSKNSNFKEIQKDSYNYFLSEFNKKNQNKGRYIDKINFYSKISKEILDYIEENPLKNENKKNSAYQMEPFEYNNGNIYQGKWNKDLEFDGYGKYFLKQENVFVEGDWENGYLNYGRIFFPNGDIYEGQIKDSIFNGKGKLKTNNEIYEGDFLNGEKTGKGKIIFEDGTIYEGSLEKGKLLGNGKMIWKNGYEYTGEFNDSILNGKGLLKVDNGDIYEGDFDNNLFHGKGKYKFNKSGNEYEGEFQYGAKKGKGIFTCLNQYTYEGNWDNDLPCGVGKLTNWEKNGVLKSIWRFGKIAEEPYYEKGNEEDFRSIDLNINVDEMVLNTKELPHLNQMDNNNTQYKLTTSLSFLMD